MMSPNLFAVHVSLDRCCILPMDRPKPKCIIRATEHNAHARVCVCRTCKHAWYCWHGCHLPHHLTNPSSLITHHSSYAPRVLILVVRVLVGGECVDHFQLRLGVAADCPDRVIIQRDHYPLLSRKPLIDEMTSGSNRGIGGVEQFTTEYDQDQRTELVRQGAATLGNDHSTELVSYYAFTKYTRMYDLTMNNCLSE